MPRLTKTSLRIQRCAEKATKSARNALLSSLCEDMYNLYRKNKNRLPYGHITSILHRLKPTEPWLTRNVINKAFIKYRKQVAGVNVVIVPTKAANESVIDSEISELSNVSSFEGASEIKWNVGRPAGTTADKKEASEKKVIKAKNEAAKSYASVKKTAKEYGRKVRKGKLKAIIEEVAKKNNIDVDTISPLAIRR